MIFIEDGLMLKGVSRKTLVPDKNDSFRGSRGCACEKEMAVFADTKEKLHEGFY